MSLLSLACVGYEGWASRVYYLDPQNQVNELAWVYKNGSWQFVNNNLGAQAAAASALTCFCLDNGDPRVYYLDANNYVNELFYQDSEWQYHNLGYQAAVGSPLASYANGGTAPRVYYLDANNYVNELAYTSTSWGRNTLYQAGAGSNLACYGVSGVYTRVYYQDINSVLHETAWISDHWVDTNLGYPAVPGSALACLGISGDSRLYYFDSNNNLHELSWNLGWNDTNLGYTAASGSALACWAENGVDGTTNTYGYYLDAQSSINEFYYSPGGPKGQPPPGWKQDNTGFAGTAVTPLACFGVNSSLARVYYFDSNFSVRELAWNGNPWTDTDLEESAAVPPPTITGFDPVSGPTGTLVTVNGTNFLSSSWVMFGMTQATNVQVLSPTELTVSVPDGAASGPIQVITFVGGNVFSATFFTVTAAGFSSLGEGSGE